MSLISELKNNYHGLKHDSRKNHIESMDKLSKEGFNYMEIRTTEISEEDINYFMSEGLVVNIFPNGEYPYYKLTWEMEFPDTIIRIATVSLKIFQGLKWILWLLISPFFIFYWIYKL